MTTRVNINENKDCIWCCRSTIFGNPYEIGKDGTREQVIERFKLWFAHLLKDKKFVNELEKLRDRKVGCFCKKEESCHVDIIVDYLNNNPKKENIKKNLAVIGSRNFNDKDWVFRILDKNREKIKCIVSGGCKNSADEISHDWAKKTGVPILIYYAAWHDTEDGIVDKSAGFKRNYYIINESDGVLAFWDMKSRGTANSLEIAKQLGKPVKIIDITKKS
jgi:Domain of unknown function (DUF4326)/YspA, cpYpsA-related SLOG family